LAQICKPEETAPEVAPAPVVTNKPAEASSVVLGPDKHIEPVATPKTIETPEIKVQEKIEQKVEPKETEKTEPKQEKATKPAESNNIGGLSIKGMLKKVKSAPEEGKEKLVTDTETITKERLLVAWKKMADAQVKYPRLSTAILQVEPILKEDGHTIVFMVGNSAQQDWIIKNTLPSLIGFLQKELNNKDVTLEVSVIAQAEQKKMPYTEREKAAVMLRDNPALADLAKQLDLDI
jgi:hypothetical protein